MPLKHFSLETDPLIAGLDPVFLERLDWARDRAGVPFVITSGLRDATHNADVGGVKNSSHERGLAVDLSVLSDVHRFAIIEALLFVGFTRIGIYKDAHIHVDMDTTLPQKVCWAQ